MFYCKEQAELRFFPWTSLLQKAIISTCRSSVETSQVINVYDLMVQGQACEAIEGMAVWYVGPSANQKCGDPCSGGRRKVFIMHVRSLFSFTDYLTFCFFICYFVPFSVKKQHFKWEHDVYCFYYVMLVSNANIKALNIMQNHQNYTVHVIWLLPDW